jgi:formate dehydrogenase alpha subunit
MITLSLSASENAKGLHTVLAAANLVHLLGEHPDALQIPAEYANTFGLYQMGVRPDAGPVYQSLERLPGAMGNGVF